MAETAVLQDQATLVIHAQTSTAPAENTTKTARGTRFNSFFNSPHLPEQLSLLFNLNIKRNFPTSKTRKISRGQKLSTSLLVLHRNVFHYLIFFLPEVRIVIKKGEGRLTALVLQHLAMQ